MFTSWCYTHRFITRLYDDGDDDNKQQQQFLMYSFDQHLKEYGYHKFYPECLVIS